MRGAERLAYANFTMKDFLLTPIHLAVTIAKLCGPGGVRVVIAELSVRGGHPALSSRKVEVLQLVPNGCATEKWR